MKGWIVATVISCRMWEYVDGKLKTKTMQIPTLDWGKHFYCKARLGAKHDYQGQTYLSCEKGQQQRNLVLEEIIKIFT